MINFIHPAIIFFLGAFLIPVFKGRLRQIYLLTIPILAFLSLLFIPDGTHWIYKFLDYNLLFAKVDSLSMAFGYVFVLMAFGGILYSLHLKNNWELIASFFYIGSSLGAVFAGDLITLFIFWEIMAFSSVILIWSRKGKTSLGAGFRYILVHIFGGLCLFAGIILHIMNTGSIEFGYIGNGGLASYLILVGFLLNAAVPPFSAWLSDAYPEATITGAVFLTAYTTKTAVYVLARAFPGVEILVWLGTIMAVYGVIYAVLENDIRRLLAYHIISQVGYMVAGVGIGTTLAINGVVSHAFTHILYKALLFMGAGTVIYSTGKRKLTELGGVHKSMPLTLVLYMIGGFSISGVPLFSGFVSKSMVVSASAESRMPVVWLMLMLASSGTFLHTALKLPYFTFFAKDAGIRPKEPPLNMLLGMGFLAFLCIFIGCYPAVLYRVLPYPVDFVPYTAQHVSETIQILLFTGLGFYLFLNRLAGTPTISLDTDWFYRKGADLFIWLINNPMARFGRFIERIFFEKLPSALGYVVRHPVFTIQILTGTAVLIVTIFLLIYLIIFAF